MIIFILKSIPYLPIYARKQVMSTIYFWVFVAFEDDDRKEIMLNSRLNMEFF